MKLARAFRCAFRGMGIMLRTQPNVRIHLAVGALAVTLGILVGLSAAEWTVILLCIVLVLAAETANTALELLADALHPEQHPIVGQAKDVAAAGVLVTAIAAAVIGGIVFLPRLMELMPAAAIDAAARASRCTSICLTASA
jgi:diacylglycerol kinase